MMLSPVLIFAKPTLTWPPWMSCPKKGTGHIVSPSDQRTENTHSNCIVNFASNEGTYAALKLSNRWQRSDIGLDRLESQVDELMVILSLLRSPEYVVLYWGELLRRIETRLDRFEFQYESLGVERSAGNLHLSRRYRRRPRDFAEGLLAKHAFGPSCKVRDQFMESHKVRRLLNEAFSEYFTESKTCSWNVSPVGAAWFSDFSVSFFLRKTSYPEVLRAIGSSPSGRVVLKSGPL